MRRVPPGLIDYFALALQGLVVCVVRQRDDSAYAHDTQTAQRRLYAAYVFVQRALFAAVRALYVLLDASFDRARSHTVIPSVSRKTQCVDSVCPFVVAPLRHMNDAPPYVLLFFFFFISTGQNDNDNV